MGNGVGMATPQSQQPSGPADVIAYEKNGLKIQLRLSRTDTVGTSQAMATFSNSNQSNIEAFVFQAAVPKYCKLQMGPLSSAIIAPNGTVTQSFRVINSQFGQSPAKLLMRLVYTMNGEQFQDQKPFDLPSGF